ncbi:hypothetical protein [Haloarchaeobius baliensis]|uniref:hypothetical protein n=1 Tax=Haloarchaeobius baliensis TaxID=1670458 RepID=UPI003F884710
MEQSPLPVILLVFFCITAGCFTPSNAGTEEPTHYQLGVVTDVSVPSNATVLSWNESALSDNETLQDAVASALELGTNASFVSESTYDSLRQLFHDEPHQTHELRTINGSVITVYVRFGDEILKLQLTPTTGG